MRIIGARRMKYATEEQFRDRSHSFVGIAAEAVGDHANDLGQDLVIGLDGIAELGMTHDHQPSGSSGHNCRGGGTAVKHADLAEKAAGPKRRSRLPIDLDVRLAVKQNVEGVTRASLKDQSSA
jgi:hypothetical protein